MIASIGASAASGALSQLMSALSPSSSSASTTTASTVSAFQQAVPQVGGTSTSAPPVNPLSGDMLMSLISLQTGSTSGSSSPLDTLFSAMDTDGDGQVSQSEMEGYVESAGGTQAQADSLFSALDQNGAAGVSEQQMQGAISQAQQANGGHRHHHHHMQGASGTGGQADQASNALLQAMDGNDDGAVSEDEFTSFVTANGGTAADAASDFAALDTSGSGSLTSADFAKAYQSYQTQQSQQSGGSLLVSFLDTLAKAGSAAASITA